MYSMTESNYLPNNEYQKEFDTKVVKTGEKGNYFVPERTLFYPEGGGQPNDKGKISWDNKEAKVTNVQRKDGEIRHYIEAELPEKGVEVHGEIDWERRYKHMRMHTAQHLLSWITLNMYDASTNGHQIKQDESRMDFEPADFTKAHKEKIEKAANALIRKELEVEKEFRDRRKVEEQIKAGRINLEIIPDSIDPLRVIIIGGEDICPCGGTHVNNLEEIGKITITSRKSQGAGRERIRFKLEE